MYIYIDRYSMIFIDQRSTPNFCVSAHFGDTPDEFSWLKTKPYCTVDQAPDHSKLPIWKHRVPPNRQWPCGRAVVSETNSDFTSDN